MLNENVNAGQNSANSIEQIKITGELKQLQVALLSPQRQISWHVQQPLGTEEIEKRIRVIKASFICGAILMLAMTIVYRVFIFDDSDLMIGNIMIGFSVAYGMATLFWGMPALSRKMRRGVFQHFDLKLDLDKQLVVVLDSRGSRKVKFHSGATLPAFVLPPNANAELRRLRDDVQNRLSYITGLPFA